MPPHTPRCRYCNSVGHHRSRLRLFDWPLYVFGFIPVRCKNCGARSYRHRGAELKLATDEAEATKYNRS